MAYAKINSITNANMAKVSNIAKSGFGKIAGVDTPSTLSFSDDKAISGITTTSHYLQSTTNLPTVFHHASASQNWTIVHTFEFDKDETHRAINLYFGSKYLSLNYHGQDSQCLVWLFTKGPVGQDTEHVPMYATTMDTTEKVTLIVTKNGATFADFATYANGGGAASVGGPYTSGTAPTDTAPLWTSAPTKIWLGRTAHGGGFNGSTGLKFNDLAIFDGGFDATEAAEAYNGGTTLDMRTHSRSSDLVHYWMAGDGDDAGDGTGNADGTGNVIFDMAGDCDLAMVGIDATDIVDW